MVVEHEIAVVVMPGPVEVGHRKRHRPQLVGQREIHLLVAAVTEINRPPCGYRKVAGSHGQRGLQGRPRLLDAAPVIRTYEIGTAAERHSSLLSDNMIRSKQGRSGQYSE